MPEVENNQESPRTPSWSLAMFGTRSRWKHIVLAAGAVLVVAGVAVDGLAPSAWSAAGLGIWGGFVVGRVLRLLTRAVRRVLLIVALLVAALAIFGPFSGETLGEWWSAIQDWFAGTSQEARSTLTRYLPSGVSTVVGLFAGLGRK